MKRKRNESKKRGKRNEKKQNKEKYLKTDKRIKI